MEVNFKFTGEEWGRFVRGARPQYGPPHRTPAVRIPGPEIYWCPEECNVSVCQLSSVREGEGICGINSNFFNAGFVRCDMYMYMYWYGMGMYARTRKPARSQRKQQQMTKINTNSTNEERNGTERNVKGLPSEFRKEKGKHVEISEKDRFTGFALLSIRIRICQQ